MNWGLRITILASGFVVFMSFLVISAFRQDFDLVAEDYYGKELQFQKQIEKQTNQERLQGTITFADSAQDVIIRFPQEFRSSQVSGKIVFFRPSDARKDLVREIRLEHGQQVLDKKYLLKGLYRVHIDYKVDGKEYYFEDSIMI